MADEGLIFEAKYRESLDPYLPEHASPEPSHLATAVPKPFLTLTYATSLDSQIALSPGKQTVLSGPKSKAMTYYLRLRHDAILIGSGTALADNPTLNSRIQGALLDQQPQPVILDRRHRFAPDVSSKMVQAYHQGKGKKPWVLILGDQYIGPQEHAQTINLEASDFAAVLDELAHRGIRSIMVEGGGQLINSILQNHYQLIDSLIITIAPKYLGIGGVVVSPERSVPGAAALELEDSIWVPLEKDVVMCGRVVKGAS